MIAPARAARGLRRRLGALNTRVSNVDAFILPAPHEVAQSLYDDRSPAALQPVL